MKDKESYVYDVFQTVAEGYDAANERISLGQHARWKRKVAGMLCAHMPTSPRILDIGCGTGDMLAILADASPTAELVGLDFSPNMLDVAAKRLCELLRITLVQGNALDLPFENESFDGVSIAFALRNTADYKKVLQEALRVLKTGGSFVCIDSFVPSLRLVRPFYYLYFSVVMPLVGGRMKNWREYRWLSESTRQFVSVKDLTKLMTEVGYHGIQCKTFMLGACACVYGRRPQ